MAVATTTAEADYAAAIAYETGTDDVHQSIGDFVRCLISAADKGHAVAQYSLSRLYRRGRGVKADRIEAERYARLSAAQNYIPAIGICYEIGYGVPIDKNLANDMFLAAHAAGDPAGTIQLILSYWNNNDESKSFEYARIGAAMADAECIFELADHYSQGIGVDSDDDRAFELFQTAAKLGNVDAYGRLGYCYSKGIGVNQNRLAAFHWYHRAAQQMHSVSQYYLAKSYWKGHADPADVIDVEQAVRWLKRSDDCRAVLFLGRLYEAGTVGMPPPTGGGSKRLADPDFVVSADLRKAVECFRSVVDDDPETDSAVAAGDILRRLGRTD
jgi:hypothetical protein